MSRLSCFGLGKADRQAAAERDSQNREAILSAQQAAAQLRQQLAVSTKREEDLRREVAAHEDRQQELMQRLTEQEAELAGASELGAQQEQRIQSLEAECQANAGQILTLQQKLEGSSRQAKAMQTQVVELKAEVAKKLRQQEQLKSKYLKMQEAMKMLEEVVVCVVGGQPDMPPGGGPAMGGPGGRSAPGGARLAPLPAGSRAGQQPPSRMQQDRAGQDSLVAKRFSQLRQSANDLRLSFAALSAEAAAGERKLASQAPECVPENEENDDGPADQMCKVAPSHSLPETGFPSSLAPSFAPFRSPTPTPSSGGRKRSRDDAEEDGPSKRSASAVPMQPCTPAATWGGDMDMDLDFDAASAAAPAAGPDSRSMSEEAAVASASPMTSGGEEAEAVDADVEHLDVAQAYENMRSARYDNTGEASTSSSSWPHPHAPQQPPHPQCLMLASPSSHGHQQDWAAAAAAAAAGGVWGSVLRWSAEDAARLVGGALPPPLPVGHLGEDSRALVLRDGPWGSPAPPPAPLLRPVAPPSCEIAEVHEEEEDKGSPTDEAAMMMF